MAKADLTLPNGTKVRIEGTAEDVAVLLAKWSGTETATKRVQAKRRPKRGTRRAIAPKKSTKQGPGGLITGLAQEGFFKTKKRLPEIQKKLEEQGHIYAQTSLSPSVLRLTKKKILRRLKEKKGWAYVRGLAGI